MIVGTTAGIVFVYEKESERFHSLWRDETFANNEISCIDVHYYRVQYVVCGFAKGQIALLDVSKLQQHQEKSVKIIKEHHKSPVVSVKFCDFLNERPHYKQKQEWMILSCDRDGRVIVTKISAIAFSILSVEKIVAVDPVKEASIFQSNAKFQSLCCRFHSNTFPQEVADDTTIVAYGSQDRVLIETVGDK